MSNNSTRSMETVDNRPSQWTSSEIREAADGLRRAGKITWQWAADPKQAEIDGVTETDPLLLSQQSERYTLMALELDQLANDLECGQQRIST